jgi:DNA invertase Pin-like site-specific DNA recombinase
MDKSIATYRRISKKETARKTDAYLHQGWLLDRKAADFPHRSRLSFEDQQSGRKDDRPDFLRLIKAIESDKIDVLIITRIDRIGRDVESNAKLQKQLQRKKVQVFEILLGRFLDWDNPNDWSYFVQAGLDGEKESRMLSTRVRQTSEFLRSQGKVGCGRVGFPYRRSKAGFVEADPDQWELAIKCIKIVIAEGGATMTALAQIRALGLSRTRTWLHRWIRSPLLRGHMPLDTRNDRGGSKRPDEIQYKANNHPSLFKDPRLKGAEKKVDRLIAESVRIKGVSRSRTIHPLSGLIYCGRCGTCCHIHRIANSKYPHKKYTYVMCGDRSTKGIGCGGQYGMFQGQRKSINAVYSDIEAKLILALTQKAKALIDLEIAQASTTKPENPAIEKLRSEIQRLVSFDDPDLLSAITKKTEQLNKLILTDPAEDFSIELRTEFISLFESGNVFLLADDIDKRTLYQEWVQRIEVDRQTITIKLAI